MKRLYYSMFEILSTSVHCKNGCRAPSETVENMKIRQNIFACISPKISG